MAFWGAEVKPGKPFTLDRNQSNGRLRISQAALGVGYSAGKSYVQCNVGERLPVLLCVLLHNKLESCHLDLEFEEADDVVFSVTGQRSVYLTGYYLQKNQHSNPLNHSDTEPYGVDIGNTHTEESSYCSDDDKYDDSFIDDLEPGIAHRSSLLSSGEDKMDLHKQLIERNPEINRNNYALHEVDNGVDCSELRSNSGKATQMTMSDDMENIAHLLLEMGEKSKEDGDCGQRSKEKLETDILIDKEREIKMPLDDERTHFEDEHSVLPLEQQSLKNDVNNEISFSHVNIQGNGAEAAISDQILPTDIGKECNQPLECGARTCSKSEKKRKKSSKPEDKTCEVLEIDGKFGILKADEAQEVEAAENIQTEKRNRKRVKEKAQCKVELDMEKPDTTDNLEYMDVKYDDKSENAVLMRNWTLPHGLVIEEVANGPPDGKLATFGKKIKVYYTGMLKKNGCIFDSNVGGIACNFQLGNEEFIDGLNIGIEGMRVGDKRRLTIPPSLGFDGHAMGDLIPPNSWLVYDVELVKVHR